MATDKELKKLVEAVAAVAEDVAHLRADIAKLDGRVAFIENKITVIDQRLDREAIRHNDQRTAERDLELERQVFGAGRPRRTTAHRPLKRQPVAASRRAVKTKGAKRRK